MVMGPNFLTRPTGMWGLYVLCMFHTCVTVHCDDFGHVGHGACLVSDQYPRNSCRLPESTSFWKCLGKLLIVLTSNFPHFLDWITGLIWPPHPELCVLVVWFMDAFLFWQFHSRTNKIRGDGSSQSLIVCPEVGIIMMHSWTSPDVSLLVCGVGRGEALVNYFYVNIRTHVSR